MSPKTYGHSYWRSPEALAGVAGLDPAGEHEFPEGGSELELDRVSRRRFMGIMGASAAFAGVGTGCWRKPREEILPYATRPEDLIPGKPMHYATAWAMAGTVLGLVVESHDGRPTKVEGNPKHSSSQGSTHAWAQAMVLDLYDPHRSKAPRKGEAEATWADAEAALAEQVSGWRGAQGKGLALVLGLETSPSVRAQLEKFKTAYPNARIFMDEPAAPEAAIAAAEAIAGKGARATVHLDDARVIVAADADLFGTDPDAVRLSREWGRGRRIGNPDDADRMNRLWVVEPHFTGTGMVADHRLRAKGSEVGDLLLALLAELQANHASFFKLDGAAATAAAGLPKPELSDDKRKAFVAVLAKDLAGNTSSGAVVVGQRQPLWVHGVGLLINLGLGNVGKTVRLRLDRSAVAVEPLSALAAALPEIETVIALGTNPAYNGLGDAGLAAALAGKTVIHAGHYVDETGAKAAWHLNLAHDLESWGDQVAPDGTTSLVQPLIAPLFEGAWSKLELLQFLTSGTFIDGYSLVKTFWQQQVGPAFSDRRWRRWLHDGVLEGIPRDVDVPALERWDDVTAGATARAVVDGLELNFHVCPKAHDGRFGTNAWMQELPHPMTKVVWDNLAYVSVKTAEKLGLKVEEIAGKKHCDVITLTVDGRSVQLPVFIAPGQADDTVSVNLGYGRDVTPVSQGVGADVNPLRSAAAPWFAAGSVAKAGTTAIVITTQDHGSMKVPVLAGFKYPERPIVLENTVEGYKSDPTFVEAANLMPKSRLKHLWDPPKLEGPHQWGMTIDLGTCTGCNACVVACQAENNIPVVGKDMVGMGREMHWMRIDRYYRSEAENPETVDEPTAVVQPMTCLHCESAPCETVCPVAATVHGPEGTNDMAYNRCIGTRYCSNNCPYKVRRYNFFHYQYDVDPLKQMQFNPDVTVRFRGVMEKCTYCIQRINEAKYAAHVRGEELVPDGTIVTACEQACPTQAITFGNIDDPNSRVAQRKAQPNNYAVLRDLNTGPRTTYLARIRNPHPELA
jgi:molybdopterin-containing oxidoreductase family iron-sulfur binding subunit